jgi:hypothetical protein
VGAQQASQSHTHTHSPLPATAVSQGRIDSSTAAVPALCTADGFQRVPCTSCKRQLLLLIKTSWAAARKASAGCVCSHTCTAKRWQCPYLLAAQTKKTANVSPALSAPHTRLSLTSAEAVHSTRCWLPMNICVFTHVVATCATHTAAITLTQPTNTPFRSSHTEADTAGVPVGLVCQPNQGYLSSRGCWVVGQQAGRVQQQKCAVTNTSRRHTAACTLLHRAPLCFA